MSVRPRVGHSTLFRFTLQIFVRISEGRAAGRGLYGGPSELSGMDILRALRSICHQIPGLKGTGRVTLHSPIQCLHCVSPVGYKVGYAVILPWGGFDKAKQTNNRKVKQHAGFLVSP